MILVSGAVKDQIKSNEFIYRHLDNVKVKGKLPHNELIKVKITSVDYPNVIGEI